MGRMILAVLCLLAVQGAQAGYLDRDDVRGHIEALMAEHDFDGDWLRAVLGDAKRQESILEAISRPAEKTMAWHEYRDIFLGERRIRQGVAFWDRHEQTLAQAERDYAVPPELIVAVAGVETRYGRITGKHRVIDALMTLGFDYPPRAKFFRGQLDEFLLLARAEGRDPLTITGSYAGAMGLGQFIPSSFRAYAVDFDGDGRRDIWNNEVDALGSIANYFVRHGWSGQGPVALRLNPGDGDEETLAALVGEGLELGLTVADVRGRGIDVGDLAGDAEAAVFAFEGEDGPEYWLALHDFYVITRYNHSSMYALAVYQLAEAIRMTWQGQERREQGDAQ